MLRKTFQDLEKMKEEQRKKELVYIYIDFTYISLKKKQG